MRIRNWVALILIVAGPAEGLTSSAIALCRPSAQAACCCGPHCVNQPASGPGMRSACCDMQRGPLRGAEPSTTSQNTAPVSPTIAPCVSAVITPTPLILDASSVSWPGVPETLHAPPLYDLFRSYRI